MNASAWWPNLKKTSYKQSAGAGKQREKAELSLFLIEWHWLVEADLFHRDTSRRDEVLHVATVGWSSCWRLVEHHWWHNWRRQSETEHKHMEGLKSPARGWWWGVFGQVAHLLWPMHPRLRPACQNSSFILKCDLTLLFSLCSYAPKLSLMVKVGPVQFPMWFHFINRGNKAVLATFLHDITALSHLCSKENNTLKLFIHREKQHRNNAGRRSSDHFMSTSEGL